MLNPVRATSMKETAQPTTTDDEPTDKPMLPTKAFTSHLARFAFSPSPTKLALAPISTATPPSPARTSLQPSRSPESGSSASARTPQRPTRSTRSTAVATSRHFGSTPAEPKPAASRAAASRAVKAEEEDAAYRPEADEPVRKKAKVGKSKKKPARAYADPSVYAHLGGVPDTLDGNISLVLCGEQRFRSRLTRYL